MCVLEEINLEESVWKNSLEADRYGRRRRISAGDRTLNQAEPQILQSAEINMVIIKN